MEALEKLIKSLDNKIETKYKEADEFWTFVDSEIERGIVHQDANAIQSIETILLGRVKNKDLKRDLEIK